MTFSVYFTPGYCTKSWDGSKLSHLFSIIGNRTADICFIIAL